MFTPYSFSLGTFFEAAFLGRARMPPATLQAREAYPWSLPGDADAARPPGTTMELQSLAAYPGARCTDGSPAGYYWSPGQSGSSDWIVLLEPGGWCWDAPSCFRRCNTTATQHYCTSRNWPAVRHLGQADREAVHGRTLPRRGSVGGILHSNEPRLANANKILLPYCTSDAHMGDATAFGLEFRGAAVVRAVLSELVLHHGLGGRGLTGPRDTLLFGGMSAGARGAMVHLDYVRESLPLAEAVRQRVEVRGYLDSVMWIDKQPFTTHGKWRGASFEPTWYGFANSTRQVFSYANVTHLGDQCAARWDGAERWRCLFGEHRLPLIRTPYMAIGSQFDSYQLGFGLGCRSLSCSPTTPEEMKFAWQLANETARLARSLAVGQRFIYSSRCHSHAVSLDTPGFVTPGCGGVSFEAALLRFLDAAAYGSSTSRTELPQLSVEQQCNDFDCCCRPGR